MCFGPRVTLQITSAASCHLDRGVSREEEGKEEEEGEGEKAIENFLGDEENSAMG